ncbi:MAG: purine biosynthesis protein PurH [Agathobacter sp.]|nr:purine biosynthesis protein PurH [Agathobacter sp.]
MQKSILIKDTTKEERIALIREWIPVEEGLEDCEIDLWDMYRDYINGEKEIAQINEEFQMGFYEESDLQD